MFESQIENLILRCDKEIEKLETKIKDRLEVYGDSNYCEFYDDKICCLLELKETWERLYKKWRAR